MFINKKITSNQRKTNIRPIRVQNVDRTENVDGRITEKCLITFYICGKHLAEWFYVTALGDQSLILGLPWLEEHNPIVDWADKTLEFQDSEKDKIKASLQSTYQRIDRSAMPDWDLDLVVRYLSSHKGSETMDQQWKDFLFEDIGSWSEDAFDQVTIR